MRSGNPMKRLALVFLMLLAEGCYSAVNENNGLFIGNWLEETETKKDYIQGFVLKPDGTAASIGMATLKYEKWTTNGSTLVMSGKSIGNRQVINFSDEWQVLEISPCRLKVKQSNGLRINYHCVKKIPASCYFL